MNEMVERVAEAIAVNGNGGTWDDWYNESQREFHRKRARAAIAAMREPTGEMRDAGATVYETIAGQPSRTWRAMIDEALK